MLRQLTLLFALLLLPTVGWAQRCGVTDTIPIDAFGEQSLIVPIDGYLNDDLAGAAQGLCNVKVYFRHSYVYGLQLSLVSPAGDSVHLVGPVSDQTRSPTSLARWFVDFTDCAAPTDPDPGAPLRWNNTDPFNWPAFGTFQGTYQPARGCFSAIDSGPVNGDWELVIRNNRSGEQGVLTYLLLEFCDDRHVEGPCCYANAGTLEAAPPLVTCEEPANLPVPLIPRYRQPRPDAATYAYTSVIARNDSILWVEEVADISGYPAGAYEVCGLSYRASDLASIALDGSLSPRFAAR